MTDGDGSAKRRRAASRPASPLRDLRDEIASLAEGMTAATQRTASTRPVTPRAARPSVPGQPRRDDAADAGPAAAQRPVQARYVMTPLTPIAPEPPTGAPPWPMSTPTAPPRRRSDVPPLRRSDAPLPPWSPRELTTPRAEPSSPARPWLPEPAAPPEPAAAPWRPPAPAPRATVAAPARAPRPPLVQLADPPDPGSRPWTPELAMEPLPPLSPADMATRELVLLEPPRSRLMTATAVIAVAAAVFVLVASHLDLAHTQAPAFAVNELSASEPAAAAGLAPPGHFSTTAREIDVQASYVGAVPGDTLTIQVRFGSTAFPPSTARLAPGTGTVSGAISPSGPAFQAGVYTVTALWHNQTVREAQFTVDAPGTRG